MTRAIYTYITVVAAAVSITTAGEDSRSTHSGVTTLDSSTVVIVEQGGCKVLRFDKTKNAKYYDIEWFRNNELLPGAKGPELRIQPAAGALVGSYHARLSTPCSQITTAPVFIERDQLNNEVVSRPFVVADIGLDDIYPNPVTDKATISFRLPKAQKVMVYVTDLVGNNVAIVVNSTLPAGIHTVEYVVQGAPSSSSMYNVVLEAPGYSVVKPMLVVK